MCLSIVIILFYNFCFAAREDFFPVAQRPRHSPYPLLPVNEAIKIILEETPWSPATIEKDLAGINIYRFHYY